ncbi:FadR/GntR family transcriptional regulator [Oceanicola sp. 22II-s10i]|uniref:FadR/GntR family transcriptional regulator n=1 Tax=Oceanicola sp. 22II-s10i TaxID=1317116 RepID=UPI000B521A21|nr:FCD domain-containing protein [Oceanicola sp. 22II-s10i]
MQNGVRPEDMDKMRDELKDQLRDRLTAAEPGAGSRRYEVLARELRQMILGGALRVGDPLPAERELVDLAGIGRGSVREAIRILESEGLLAPKSPGRKGVSVVQSASDRTVTRQLEFFIGGDSVSNSDLLEARLVIEPALAVMACEHRTDEDIARMREINARIAEIGLTDRGALVRLNLDWHVAMFRASHNDLLVAIATGLTETHHQAKLMESHGSGEHARHMAEAHGKILDAIVARDKVRAERRARKHLQGYANSLARLNPAEFDISRLNPR